jgi:hypothetical protein
MRGGAQRYGNASCPLDIDDISFLYHVRPARQVIFCVFRSEKCIPSEKKRIFLCAVRRARQTVSCSAGSAGNYVIGGLPGKPSKPHSKYYRTNLR